MSLEKLKEKKTERKGEGEQEHEWKGEWGEKSDHALKCAYKIPGICSPYINANIFK